MFTSPSSRHDPPALGLGRRPLIRPIIPTLARWMLKVQSAPIAAQTQPQDSGVDVPGIGPEGTPLYMHPNRGSGGGGQPGSPDVTVPPALIEKSPSGHSSLRSPRM